MNQQKNLTWEIDYWSGSTIINGRFVLITLSQTKEGSSKTFKEDICQMFYVLGKLIDEHAALAAVFTQVYLLGMSPVLWQYKKGPN